LNRNGADAKSVPPQDMPKAAEAFRRYDLVVLSNVAPNLLSDDQQAALKAYVEGGGGLLAIGGDKAFRPQALADSTLETLLPITGLEAARTAQASLAMVLVIDKSKSMDPIPGRSADKMGLAKQAAKLAVDILQPSDQIGVITFSDNTNWVSDLATLDNKRRLKQDIDAIVAEGGTNMYAALDKAYLALRRADAKLKHVIVLTDGISVPGDFKQIATRMAEEGITVSTVAIGKGVAGAVLTDISDAGRGRHYLCQDPESLPAIVARETRSASEAVASEQPFRAQSIHVPPRLVALQLDRAPPLGGYAETTPKRRGQLVLTSEAGDPLLAWWRYKKGTVVAFTADAERRWTKPWLDWANYDDFWLELAQMAMRRQADDGISVQIVTSDADARIVVDVVDEQGAPANGWSVALDADGEVQPFRQTMPGRYALSVDAGEEVSARTLTIDDRKGKKTVRKIAFAQNYPHELRLRATNEKLLREIADVSGGRYDVSSTAVFDADDRTATRVVPLWPYFVMLGLLAFLVDVVLRRVDFARWIGKPN
ncbi:MAG: VWA domain-containing protein, partial [Pirellulales bacterium]|nr:VWA domain-containing protein [Pirellulales bacterium]